MRLEILKYVYQHFLEKGTPICYVIFDQIDTNTLEVQNSLKNLEVEGYIETSRPSIGAIYARLTDYGLSFCEQSFSL